MADMEMIDPNGVRATFSDEGIVVDVVPLSECCELCNDPRMVDVNGIKTCPFCHNINIIELNHHG